MKVIGSRKQDRAEMAFLNQFAEKIPKPFEVIYDADSFIFNVRLQLNSNQAISQEALTESFVDVVPSVIRRQLEAMRVEVARLLRELCGVYELPNSLVTREQWLKYQETKSKERG